MNDAHVYYEKSEAGYTVRVYQDELTNGPRGDWNCFGKMLCFHKRYTLGDEGLSKEIGIDPDDYSGWDEIEDALINDHAAAVILPLYMYDHSGITMNTTGFGFSWDSGQVGFTFATNDDVVKEYGDLSKESLNKAEELLVNEVETYDKYLRGDVYGYTLDSDDEYEELDDYGCWGYYDYGYCVEEADRALQWHVDKAAKRAGEKALEERVGGLR